MKEETSFFPMNNSTVLNQETPRSKRPWENYLDASQNWDILRKESGDSFFVP